MAEADAPKVREHYTETMKRRIAELEAENAALRAAQGSGSPVPVKVAAAALASDELAFMDRILTEQGAKMSAKDRAGVNLERQYSAVRSAVAARRLLLAQMRSGELPDWSELRLDPDTGEPIPDGVSYQRYKEGYLTPADDGTGARPTVELKGRENKPVPPPTFDPNKGAPAKVLEIAGLSVDAD